MKYLGIDYGTKKIGLALSDESGKFAFPHKVIPNKLLQAAIKEIKKICEKNSVEKIVLGKPVGYKGDGGEILNKIEGFKKEVESATGITIDYENEVLTTKQAKRPQILARPRGKIADLRKIFHKPYEMADASAAAIILQTYLDRY